jgi:uncharacterized protein YjbI with pentapeptide repeats
LAGFREKRLWDFLQLLIIPIVLLLGGAWLQSLTKEREQAAVVDKTYQETLIRYQETLIKHLDTFLAVDNLSPDTKEFMIAQVSTVTALQSLDLKRQLAVIQFLRALHRGSSSAVKSQQSKFAHKNSNEYGLLFQARMREADLQKLQLQEIDLRKIDLTNSNLTEAALWDANLTDANLWGINLTEANLGRADLTGADLTDANLTDAKLIRANLTKANFTDANLTDAKLIRANLTKANFTSKFYMTESDLQKLLFTEIDLREIDFTNANLTEANLTGANFAGANLTGADLTGAINLTKQQVKLACNWENAIGIDEQKKNLISKKEQDKSLDPIISLKIKNKVLLLLHKNFRIPVGCLSWSPEDDLHF